VTPAETRLNGDYDKGEYEMLTKTEVMIGNQAIALGLVEAGVELAAAYPGTPSSEILPAIVEFKKRTEREIHIEWSVNERVAMEVAFGAATGGKKAVCIMKQVGLNVAFPPFVRGKAVPIEGSLVIISCDDPVPQSSQTEQDSRLIATLFGVPTFDVASPAEARLLASQALTYSAKTRMPVLLRLTHRVSHARVAIPLEPPSSVETSPGGDMGAWGNTRLGIAASGMTYNVVMDVLSEFDLQETLPVLKVVQIFPFSPDLDDFARQTENLLVLEEPDEVLEALIGTRTRVLGRGNGFVPQQGELTYDVVRRIIQEVVREVGIQISGFSPDGTIENGAASVCFPARPPKLCAGCPHRASFYAMRQAYPKALFSGDIGCYTLGISQGAVDTCIDMGGSIGLAAGFYDTLSQDGPPVPILASLGDSTFFHAGLPLLYDAARKGKQFVVVLMDNGTTAMTGMQPTPQSGMRANGTMSDYMIPIEQVMQGLGVKFLKIVDPYDVDGMIKVIREGVAYTKKTKQGPAVIIARRPCLLQSKQRKYPGVLPDLATDCTGCKKCIKFFGCPAILFNESDKRVTLDEALCVNCGVCLSVCPRP
jgi:indolepyruvate ferredoxin oxidoreductase, alpha subunit